MLEAFVRHNLCEHCWHKANPRREPVRVAGNEAEKCCSCGCPTYTGIYVRGEAAQYTDCVHSPKRFDGLQS